MQSKPAGISTAPVTDQSKFITNKVSSWSVADPGFPVGGGAWTSYGGAVDPRGGYVSKVLHVKMKESGPVGGGARAGRVPPRSANGGTAKTTKKLHCATSVVGWPV